MCVKCMFDLEYFQHMMDLLGCNPIINQAASVPVNELICKYIILQSLEHVVFML